MDFEHARALGHLAQQESEIRKLKLDLMTMTAINAHQSNPRVHELTCDNDDCRRAAGGKLIAFWDGAVKLRCPDCTYVQTYIPQFLAAEAF